MTTTTTTLARFRAPSSSSSLRARRRPTSSVSASASSTPSSLACPRSPTRRGRRRRSCNILRASDDDKKDTLGNLDSILGSGDEEKEAAPAPETEKRVDDGFFERKEMSKAQQDKLRKELLGFGGSPDTAMGANYYLYIIVIISALAVAAKLSGAF